MSDIYARLEEFPLRKTSRWQVSVHHRSSEVYAGTHPACGQHYRMVDTEDEARKLAAEMLATHEEWCARTRERRVVIVEAEA